MAYTYYIYHKPTQQHYYGARWAKSADPSDLWSTYFTSSSSVKLLIEQYGVDSFEVEVRKVFSTGIEARMWEHKVLKRLRAWKRANWLNKSNGQPPVCTYSRKGQGAGRKLSPSHCAAIAAGTRGISKPHTPEHIQKAANARRGLQRSSETKQLMSKSSRAAKPIYLFVKGSVSFTGTMSDWAEAFDLNVKSASTVFCSNKPYKGWVRC